MVSGTDVNTLSSFLGGGLVGVVLTLISNWLLKKREELVNISNVRVQTISRAAPYYNRIALQNAWNFSQKLGMKKEEYDYKLMMYYLCNIIHLHDEIIKLFGDIQLENLDAEKIVARFLDNILSMIIKEFGHLDTSRLASLVEDDIRYHIFFEIISSDGNKELYQKFVNWICRTDVADELKKNCSWFAQVIMYELNYVYSRWYGEGPELDKIGNHLKEFLLEEFPQYYKRIHHIETGAYLYYRKAK